jgi:hypothetical protein
MASTTLTIRLVVCGTHRHESYLLTTASVAKERRTEAKQMRLLILCDVDMPWAFWNHAIRRQEGSLG